MILRSLPLCVAIAVNDRLIPWGDGKGLTLFVPYGLLSSSAHPIGGVVSGVSSVPYALESDADTPIVA